MPDLHTSSAAYADEETVDTDFVHHLVRGAELLQTGEAAQARGMLERALRLRPKNQRGQNLLALSYFKLGQFDRAEQIYRALIEEYPNDPTLRVNLGLVHMKTGRSEEAILAFSSALDLDPTHTKAQSYLGLTYMQLRDFPRAQEWFVRCGNTAMAERMAAMSQAPERSAEVTMPPIDLKSAMETTPVHPNEAWSPMETTAVVPDLTLPETLEVSAPDLASFSAAVRVQPNSDAIFSISPTLVTVEVHSEIYVRVDGLVAVFGALELKPAFKRFRGRVTEKPFGEAGRRMMNVAGKGRLWIGASGRQFHAVEIGDEPAYFKEEALFGFEESLLFENGRVPSKLSADLQLIHLRNRGRALIVSKHPPRSVEVTRDTPCRVLLDVLIGWHGSVTPRVAALTGEGAPDGAVVGIELVGEGRVLLDAPL